MNGTEKKTNSKHQNTHFFSSFSFLQLLVLNSIILHDIFHFVFKKFKIKRKSCREKNKRVFFLCILRGRSRNGFNYDVSMSHTNSYEEFYCQCCRYCLSDECILFQCYCFCYQIDKRCNSHAYCAMHLVDDIKIKLNDFIFYFSFHFPL